MNVVWRVGLLCLLSCGVYAQRAGVHLVEEVDETSRTNLPPSVLMFNGHELFELASISSVSAVTRADSIQRQMKRAAKSPLVNTENFSIHHDENIGVSVIMHEAEMLCTIWDSDAELNKTPRRELSEKWHAVLTKEIENFRRDRTMASIIRSSVYAVFATVIYLIIWFLIRKVLNKEMKFVEARLTGKQTLKILDGDGIVAINANIMKVFRILIMLQLFIVYLNIVLSFFPWTFNLSAKLFEMVSTPVINFGHAFVANLPNLFAMLVIIAITVFVLRSLKHIFKQIDLGRVRIRGFYRDWADPTYRLIRIMIIVFAIVVAFPFIPGSSSPAFKGISIFMGVLFSLGSTSAVGNIVAGLVLTYMRPFVNDDFVEISGLRGSVVSRGTFATQLKTPTNEIISIPNASVSTNHIINFSRMAERGGVNLGTSVTIGYDVPWRKVHELLIASAEGVEDVLQSHPPKVLQLSLDDFYVEYKLIVTTKHPERRFTIRSNLHQNIQDNFAKAGVEILSAHYQSNRQGNDSTVPDLEGINNGMYATNDAE